MGSDLKFTAIDKTLTNCFDKDSTDINIYHSY